MHEGRHYHLEDLALLEDEIMGFLFCFVDDLLSKTELEGETSSLAVPLNEYADGSVLDAECHRTVPPDVGIFWILGHYVAPIEETDVLDRLLAIKQKSNCIQLQLR